MSDTTMTLLFFIKIKKD